MNRTRWHISISKNCALRPIMLKPRIATPIGMIICGGVLGFFGIRIWVSIGGNLGLGPGVLATSQIVVSTAATTRTVTNFKLRFVLTCDPSSGRSAREDFGDKEVNHDQSNQDECENARLRECDSQ